MQNMFQVAEYIGLYLVHFGLSLLTCRHVEMVCVRDFRDLCLQLSPRESFGESRRNGILVRFEITMKAAYRKLRQCPSVCWIAN